MSVGDAMLAKVARALHRAPPPRAAAELDAAFAAACQRPASRPELDMDSEALLPSFLRRAEANSAETLVCASAGELRARIGDMPVAEAFCAIAETGSVALSSTDAPLAESFLRDELCVRVCRADLVADFEAAWRRMRQRYRFRMPRSIVLMSGPSRTADIEQKLQIGAHGPRRLLIAVEG